MTSSNLVKENLAKIEKFLALNTEQFNLLILPENFAQMAKYAQEKLQTQEIFGQGFVQTWLSDLSKEYQCWIIAGSFPIQSEDTSKPFARSLVYNPNGALETYYDKIHLFDVAVSQSEAYCESNDTQPGLEPTIVEINSFKVGLSICYDLRFPELYRYYQQQDVDLLVAPSAFTYETGRCHWDLLLKSRAVENLCYMAAVNQTGFHANGRRTYGHSQIISAWGETVAELEEQEALFIYELSKEHLAKIRGQFPAHTHRKL